MRTLACVGLVAVCLTVPGVSWAGTRAVPAGVNRYQEGEEGGGHERQQERRENRVDRKDAKRELDSARKILNRMRPDRDQGISRDSLDQVKAQFADLYKDFNEANGRSDRERRDWQADYHRIQRMLDGFNVRERGEGAIGTSGHREEAREHGGDLAQFRDRLEAFYNAAAGHQWRRQQLP